MNNIVLQIPDSTARLVLKELGAGGPALTQAQLAAQTGRTPGSVCKALKLLMDNGYAQRAGKTVNRSGRSVGKCRLLFSGTRKALMAEAGLRHLEASTMRELAAIVDDLVRCSLAARCGQEFDQVSL